MDTNSSTTSARGVQPPPQHHGPLRGLLTALLVAAVGFILGNLTPPLRTWLPGFADQVGSDRRNEEADQQKPLSTGLPAKEMAARWNTLRDKTYEELRVAERILAVMGDKGVPEIDFRGQKEKVKELRKRLEHCDTRLGELDEADPPSSKAKPKEMGLDELDIQHRQVIDQRRLQKIGPGQ